MVIHRPKPAARPVRVCLGNPRQVILRKGVTEDPNLYQVILISSGSCGCARIPRIHFEAGAEDGPRSLLDRSMIHTNRNADCDKISHKTERALWLFDVGQLNTWIEPAEVYLLGRNIWGKHDYNIWRWTLSIFFWNAADKIDVSGSLFCSRLGIHIHNINRIFNIFNFMVTVEPPLWSSGPSSWLQIRRPGFDSRHYQEKKVVGLERGPLSLVSTIEELLDRKSSGSCLENREYGRMDPSRWPRGTLYPSKSWLSLRWQAAVARSVKVARGLRPWSFFLWLM
jgi:hypothetical protein